MVDRVDGIAGLLHRPGDGETVALLLSDRHDNIGMDDVAKAIGDAGGASVVLDAGDDTSVGQPWESFSLDSLDKAFDEYDKVAISGNHDHGSFVSTYLARRGWTHLDGDAVTPFGDVRITGVDDPRSSGLGGWRDETVLTFAEVKESIADDVCADDADGNRIAALLVHDANLGATALERGCTDLVLAGHLHVQKGPTRVVGANGKAGYSYTNGTTGGAAYAIALGSKLRRDAEVTLVTFADGRPVGLQPVTIRTTGESSSRRTSSSTSADMAPRVTTDCRSLPAWQLAGVAQLVERRSCKANVAGSTPVTGSGEWWAVQHELGGARRIGGGGVLPVSQQGGDLLGGECCAGDEIQQVGQDRPHAGHPDAQRGVVGVRVHERHLGVGCEVVPDRGADPFGVEGPQGIAHA